ncbi:MAG: sulfur globule protein CV3 [Chromatiaceae bacterium]|nr:MAG: sulfur globule protein CV3 [Chromatiaceae bacterium]
MINRKSLLLALILTAAGALASFSAQAFWGPFNPWNWGGPGWGGYPGWGGPGWGGWHNPWYGHGYPGWGYPYGGYGWAPSGYGYPGAWGYPYSYPTLSAPAESSSSK